MSTLHLDDLRAQAQHARQHYPPAEASPGSGHFKRADRGQQQFGVWPCGRPPRHASARRTAGGWQPSQR